MNACAPEAGDSTHAPAPSGPCRTRRPAQLGVALWVVSVGAAAMGAMTLGLSAVAHGMPPGRDEAAGRKDPIEQQFHDSMEGMRALQPDARHPVDEICNPGAPAPSSTDPSRSVLLRNEATLRQLRALAQKPTTRGAALRLARRLNAAYASAGPELSTWARAVGVRRLELIVLRNDLQLGQVCMPAIARLGPDACAVYTSRLAKLRRAGPFPACDVAIELLATGRCGNFAALGCRERAFVSID